ncbi:Capsule biosynthesis protein capA [Sandaracinus amylolyticus]|uniref:Capsule biosynthesis protein capA n=1 Tax=Sandaracinus amylolyticus TaxID=927083 RepID=A0A0F6YGW2_9BACT|nr:Capsule biosynthesis protein capA [Sandaracinus amylolyticus]
MLAAIVAGCGGSIEPSAPTPAITETPIAAVAPTPTARRVVISAAGDLVLNALAMSSVRAHGDEAAGYRALLDGYARAVRDDEIVYLNLEMPLVDDVIPLEPGWAPSATRESRAPVLGGTIALAGVLASIGVDVVGVANNHAYDQGYEGLRRTLAALDDARVAHAGTSSEGLERALEPVILERDGARVAWISATVQLNRRARGAGVIHLGRTSPIERIERAIRDARARADVVVVAPHWGRDFAMRADSEQRALARAFVDAGADVVLGTGPHVLHEVARVPSARGEAIVAYSLGNVASGMGRAYRVGHEPPERVHPANVRAEGRDGLVLRVAMTLDDDGAITIERVEGIPLWTENDFLADPDAVPHVRVVPLDEAAREVRAEREPAMRAALGDAIELVSIAR